MSVEEPNSAYRVVMVGAGFRGIAARSIIAASAGRSEDPFLYPNFRNLATIGRGDAVKDFGWLRLRGILAWLPWTTVQTYFLANILKRLLVGMSLAWSFLTFVRHARLIAGEARCGPAQQAILAIGDRHAQTL